MPRPVQVSPQHHVTLDDDFLAMIDRAPRVDFVVRTLVRRMAGESPLMSGELVIAGVETRDAYPLATQYPLHFRKTYYPGRLHTDPRIEFERHKRASELIDVPPPIGASHKIFRSCMLPGSALNRLSELGVEPEDSNIQVAQELSPASAAGLWRLAEEAYQVLDTLHSGGLCHGDAHWHNFMVCPSPLQVIPIDFEQAELQDEVDEPTWEKRRRADVQYILKLGVYLQSALGQQRGAFADACMARLDEVVGPAETFRRVINDRTLCDGFS
jgi:hypothetical protein